MLSSCRFVFFSQMNKPRVFICISLRRRRRRGSRALFILFFIISPRRIFPRDSALLLYSCPPPPPLRTAGTRGCARHSIHRRGRDTIYTTMCSAATAVPRSLGVLWMTLIIPSIFRCIFEVNDPGAPPPSHTLFLDIWFFSNIDFSYTLRDR